jgi:hypothetical protein
MNATNRKEDDDMKGVILDICLASKFVIDERFETLSPLSRRLANHQSGGDQVAVPNKYVMESS